MASVFPEQPDVAWAIMMAESNGNPNATDHNSNGTVDRGIFQINSIHSAMVNGNLESLYDIQTNLMVARELFVKQGWKPWVTFNTGAYKRYLK